jgi:hypothetical protein
MKGWKMIFQENGSQNQAEVTTLISDKVDLKQKFKKIKNYYMLIKGAVYLEDITIVNIYLPNIGKDNLKNKQYWT